MKKKIITLALSATMIVGSVFSAVAATGSVSADSSVNGSVNGSVDGSASGENNDNTFIGAIDETTAAAIEKTAKVEGLDGATLDISVITKDDAAYKALANDKNKTIFTEAVLKVTALMDIVLKDKDGKAVTAEGNYKVTLDATAMKVLKEKYVLVYVLEGDKYTLVDHVEIKDGKFTFETKHFTPYAFVATADAPKEAVGGDQIQGGDTTTGDEVSALPFVVTGVAAVAALGAAVVLKKKETEE